TDEGAGGRYPCVVGGGGIEYAGASGLSAWFELETGVASHENIGERSAEWCMAGSAGSGQRFPTRRWDVPQHGDPDMSRCGDTAEHPLVRRVRDLLEHVRVVGRARGEQVEADHGARLTDEGLDAAGAGLEQALVLDLLQRLVGGRRQLHARG